MAAVLPPSGHAEVYRWVDEQGVTQFSQTPPRAQAYDTVKVPPPPEVDAATEEQRKSDIEQLDEWQRARQEKQEKQHAKTEEAQQRKKNCENARANLDTLENLGTRMLKTPEGEYVRPTEKELEQRQEETRKAIDEFCK